jgi:hypothetical protein
MPFLANVHLANTCEKLLFGFALVGWEKHAGNKFFKNVQEHILLCPMELIKFKVFGQKETLIVSAISANVCILQAEWFTMDISSATGT